MLAGPWGHKRYACADPRTGALVHSGRMLLVRILAGSVQLLRLMLSELGKKTGLCTALKTVYFVVGVFHTLEWQTGKIGPPVAFHGVV